MALAYRGLIHARPTQEEGGGPAHLLFVQQLKTLLLSYGTNQALVLEYCYYFESLILSAESINLSELLVADVRAFLSLPAGSDLWDGEGKVWEVLICEASLT